MKKSEQSSLLCQAASVESCKVTLCNDEIPVDNSSLAKNSEHLKGEQYVCRIHKVSNALVVYVNASN